MRKGLNELGEMSIRADSIAPRRFEAELNRFGTRENVSIQCAMVDGNGHYDALEREMVFARVTMAGEPK